MSITEQTDTLSVDATIDGFLKKLTAQGDPPVYTLSPAEARAGLSAVQAGDVAKPAGSSEDRTIAGGPIGRISLRIFLSIKVPARSIEQVEDAHLVIAHGLCVTFRGRLHAGAEAQPHLVCPCR